jgi:hypothetical protein
MKKSHTLDTEILSFTVKHLVAMATCCPGFAHPWFVGSEVKKKNLLTDLGIHLTLKKWVSR